MASIHQSLTITASVAEVWDAIRDFGRVHLRVAPGFVADCRLDGDGRIVTFASGTIVRETLVDCDDSRHRLVYAISPNERVAHYQGQFVVTENDDRRCRIDWTVDLLPDAIAPMIAAQMQLGVAAMRTTLERSDG
ncbi:hypothetical protein RPB_0797 [Rhodopseudomonas palustris HaA2]|uniref:SRPBCC family protein n=1 Tax=Rhodopseudomonas palustris (strain HaA2) TaxID=316058 RepID=Q2J202_RHOP2|nr:SRPBCC family protein [Rhodopseudomonas palustris]ABD05508.1 hypothetical protein RPB_0797 [Rhodopseudomonas palustris HaA2]